MEPTPDDVSLVQWLLNRDFFKSMRYWRRDVLGCGCLAAAVAPSDPLNMLIVAVPLTAAWLLIRYAIAHNFTKDENGSRIPRSD